ncbi:MAG: TRAP transporter small permease subunit [Pseudorhodoplanes sp.]|nr:TRAP transporter small permease subunit [Pseudorhodoplanes sp.]
MIRNRVARSFAAGLECTSALFLVLVLVVVCLQVFFRNIVNLTAPWTEEAARYFCVWMVFLGCAAAVAYESHLRVTWLIDKLTGRMRSLAAIAICVVMLLFDMIVLIGSIRLARLNWHQEATTFPVSISVLYAALIVFAVSSIFFLASQIVGHIARTFQGRI